MNPLKEYFRWRYGVRGGLKPPLGFSPYGRRPTMLRRWWYRWRYICWLIEDELYQRSGLVNDWWLSMNSGVTSKAKSNREDLTWWQMALWIGVPIVAFEWLLVFAFGGLK